MKERRNHSDELKAEAVRMIPREVLTLSEAGKKLGIPKRTIGNWLSNCKDKDKAPMPGTPSAREFLVENPKLRKELAEAKMKEETLKKATAKKGEVPMGLRGSSRNLPSGKSMLALIVFIDLEKNWAFIAFRTGNASPRQTQRMICR